MGVEFNADVSVGFVIKLEDLLAPFCTKIDEKSHMEPRWDPLTGRKVDSVKVVDSHSENGWSIDGKEYEDTLEAIGALEDKFNMACFLFDDSNLVSVIPNIHLMYNTDSIENHPFYVGSSLNFDQVTNKRYLNALARICKSLLKYGIAPGDVKIHIMYDVM